MSENNIQPKRLEKIVEILNSKSYVTVKDICDVIDASPATIRRDLQNLNEKGIIDKFHGGATIKRKVSIPYSDREKENIKEKNKIALEAFQLIKENSNVILDAGTTVMQLARLLEKSFNGNLTIVTTAINIGKFTAFNFDLNVIYLKSAYRCQTVLYRLDTRRTIVQRCPTRTRRQGADPGRYSGRFR